MIFWGDATIMPSPEEYKVKVVRNDGYTWEKYGTYHTMTEANEAIDRTDKSGYRLIGIEPHCKDAGIIQTHALQVVWEA